jgi:transcriptional regulator with XRE-family HTH domain
MSEIGDRIAKTRALIRLSAAELGELAGMSRGVVGMIETNKRPEPGANTVADIATVLGVSSDWLIKGVGPEPTKEQVSAAVELARAAKKPPVVDDDDAPPASTRKPADPVAPWPDEHTGTEGGRS